MRDVGLGVKSPEKACDDPNCPFHGKLSVRGQVFDGTVVSDKMTDTVVVLREFERKMTKYDRYEKRRSKLHAHNPPCLKAKVGDVVKVAECRPISKTKSFVVVEVVR